MLGLCVEFESPARKMAAKCTQFEIKRSLGTKKSNCKKNVFTMPHKKRVTLTRHGCIRRYLVTTSTLSVDMPYQQKNNLEP